MKIPEIKPQGDATQYIEQAQKSKQPEKNQVPQSQEIKNPQTDRVDLSDQSKEMKKIYVAQQIAPDIRTERVNEVKKLIEQDRYQVDSQAVAEKMIRESIFELNR
jgi:negative regulator of flagellin synthesis FlgM